MCGSGVHGRVTTVDRTVYWVTGRVTTDSLVVSDPGIWPIGKAGPKLQNQIHPGKLQPFMPQLGSGEHGHWLQTSLKCGFTGDPTPTPTLESDMPVSSPRISVYFLHEFKQAVLVHVLSGLSYPHTCLVGSPWRSNVLGHGEPSAPCPVTQQALICCWLSLFLQLL